MKRRILSIAFILILFAIGANASILERGYKIECNIQGLENGLVVELVPGSTHRTEKTVASAKVMDGKFSFSGKVDGPRYFLLTIQGGMAFGIMVDNTDITLTGSVSLEENNGKKRYLFKDVKVLGSPVHDVYKQKISIRSALNAEHEAYNKRGEEIASKVRNARAQKDKNKVDSLVNTPAYKAFENDEVDFFNKVEHTMTKLYKDNGDSWWGPFLMLNTMSYFTPEQKSMYDDLSAAAKNSYYGKALKEQIYPEGFLGQAAPAVNAKTNANVKADLATVFKKNKYTIVDFWASWCAPCRKALPALKEFYKELDGKSVEIVSISIDKVEADWLKAEQEELLKWPSYLDNGGTTADAWKIKAIPAMFLVDQNGKVVGENLTLQQIKEKLSKS
ncbi:redoxin domain-containing protein [Pedobacter sp. MW01-1-1]|uniref:redoxin domain-containing protein n=1 Tax=Pedobacter sp. MW01-1-1 TaxID=3383027 RepID=UPI003FEF27C6